MAKNRGMQRAANKAVEKAVQRAEVKALQKSRRSFIRIAAGFLGIEALKEAYHSEGVKPLLNWIANGIKPKGALTPKPLHERLDLIYELLLSSFRPTDFIPPTSWPNKLPDTPLPDGTLTYEHERQVLAAVADFLGEIGTVWDPRVKGWQASARNSLMLIGSGVSNSATEWFLGKPEAPRFEIRAANDQIVRLEYSIGQGEGLMSRMQYGEIVEKRKNAIWNSSGRTLALPQDRSGEQLDDYLLVTRVPGAVAESTVTIVAGLHGPATRSAERLFKAAPPRDLLELASVIDHVSGTVPYFQAVFRASKLAIIDGSSVAQELELVTTGCPPRRLIVS